MTVYLLGQAQRSFREESACSHPLTLMTQVGAAALRDAGIRPEQVDAVACVDPYSWTYAELERQVGRAIGCPQDHEIFWLPGGGTTPQDLLHTIAEAMEAQALDIAVVVGAEAMRTRRKAARADEPLDWPERDRSVDPSRGQPPFTSPWEAQHGLRLPIQVFPVLENAIRAAHGRSFDAQVALAASLLHRNAQVAASNPHAWFRDAPSLDEIATASPTNRMIALPYTKRMNAIMDVDQAAAFVVVSERYVRQHGRTSEAIAVIGGAGAEEVWNPMQRASLSESAAMQAVFEATFAAANISSRSVTHFDFYSCFPAPIQMAAQALGIERDDKRPFTITGGLAYAGGPGNNYVSHAIATAVSQLRRQRNDVVLLTGVGMANTKHSATLLCHADRVPPGATGRTRYRLSLELPSIDIAERYQGRGQLTGYTVEFDRDEQPRLGIAIIDTADGRRAIGNPDRPEQLVEMSMNSDPTGRTCEVVWDEAAQRQRVTLI